MATFYEGYQQGAYQEVYDELLKLGENVFLDTFYKDAQLVAHSLMQRVRYNIELIISRLSLLGYRFGEGIWDLEDELDPEVKAMFERSMPVFKPPTSEDLLYLEKLEQLLGVLPLSLIYWYKEVGGVNLVGLFPSEEKHTFTRQDGSYLDPLLIYPVEFVLEMLRDYKRRNVWEKDPKLPLSPDSLFKYNYSGSSPYAMEFPCKAFDTPLLDEKHNTTFINYLRICMRWGGFPGLEQNKTLSQDKIAFLTKDLLPF
ncbi:MAG TPA: hypothetical protein VFV38_24190 [Ktedonobacteraceae bacterium]|nr:hypothetical protein [Ktedonobacteraceae bacterium]